MPYLFPRVSERSVVPSTVATPTAVHQASSHPMPVTRMLQNNQHAMKTVEEAFYKKMGLSLEEAVPLSINAVRDFIWSLITALCLGPAFRRTKNFLMQTLGQILIASIGVAVFAPFLALLWAKVYDVPYSSSFLYTIVSSISALGSIPVWNYMALLGVDFFTYLGADENQASWLSVLFPGIGEGTSQTVITTALLHILVEKLKLIPAQYQFRLLAFLLGLSPIAWVPGDVWLCSYLSVNDLVELSTSAAILQAALVAIATGTANFVEARTVAFLTHHLGKLCKRETEEALQEVLAEAGIAPNVEEEPAALPENTQVPSRLTP